MFMSSSPNAANYQKFMAKFFSEASRYALGESEYDDLLAKLKTLQSEFLGQGNLRGHWSGLELERYLQSNTLGNVSAPGLTGSRKESFKNTVRAMAKLSLDAQR